MKRTLLILTLMATLGLMFGVNSCKKPEKMLNEKSRSLRGLHDEVTPPTVENGILTFEDKEHYVAWLGYLDEVIARDSTSSDTTSQDSLLHDIEIGLSFTSLRQKTFEQFEALNVGGWVTIEEIPERHFLHDLSLLSVLNEYAEVQIGDDVISIFDFDHNVIIKDPELLSDVRTFKTSGYTDIEDIFDMEGVIQTGIEVNETPQIGNIEIEYARDCLSGTLSAEKPTGNIYPVKGGIQNDACNGRKIYLSKFSLTTLPDATWIVNWGDGGGPQSGGYGKFFSANHTYSSNGTYSVIIEAVTGGNSYFFYFNVIAQDGCSKGEQSKVVWYYPGNGWAVRGDLQCHNVKGNRRISSNSESYLWNGSTNVHRKCENLYASIYGEILYTNCTSEFNVIGKNSSHKAKTISIGSNINHPFGWNVITSQHAMHLNGQWYVYNLALNPCP